jgi:hypothetical protein
MQTVNDLVEAAAELWERQPSLKRIVVKLNEGFSGEGNAILDLRKIPEMSPEKASHAERVATLHERMESMSFQAKMRRGRISPVAFQSWGRC